MQRSKPKVFTNFAGKHNLLPMIKNILITLTLATAMCFCPSLQDEASARIELSELDVQPVKIEQRGNTIVISNAQGKTAHIYNLIGVEVMTVRIDAQEKRIDLSHLSKGIYPVKVANVSKKANISGR